MESEWKEYALEDCMEAIIDYRGKTPKKTDAGIPLITAKIIKNGTINPVTEFIAKEDYDSWMRRGIPKPGDVVMTTEAPLGEVAQLDSRQVALAQRVITLRGKAGFLDNRFLKYLITSHRVQHQLDGRGTGTTVRGIKQSELRKVKLNIPSFSEQKAIAHILGSLDGKIELNRQINETLESMAQVLFKSWFVDFDPVIDNALAAGNAIPEALQARAVKRQALLNQESKHPPLPENIRQQFPAAFEFNDNLGWIPEGWKASPVNEALEINPKVTLRKGDIAPFVDMKALPTTGYAINNIAEKAYSGGAKFCNGDILLARITPCLENGKTGVVDFLNVGEVGFGSTEFIILRPKNSFGTPFIACLARDQNFRKHCVQNMVGSSGRQRVQNSGFNSYYLAVPSSNDVPNLFQQLTECSFHKITDQKNEINTLTKLRDTLLPKLLSGELTIPETEQFVKEAL